MYVLPAYVPVWLKELDYFRDKKIRGPEDPGSFCFPVICKKQKTPLFYFFSIFFLNFLNKITKQMKCTSAASPQVIGYVEKRTFSV